MAQTCPNCDAPNKEGHRFCSTCGYSLILSGDKQATNIEAGSTSSAYAVQTSDNEGSGQEDTFVSPPAPTSTYSAPQIPPPPPPRPSQPVREAPPVGLDRKGEATYAPYTDEAVRHVEKGRGNRTWLMPVVGIAGLLLVVLAAAVIFLFFSPNKTSIQSPNASGSSGTPEEQLKEVVRISNDEQIKAWRELNSEVLAGTRTGAFLDENIALVEKMKKSQMYGVPVNHRLDFLDIKIDGDKATVQTLEVWSVTFHQKGDDKVVEKRGPDKYNETYHLVKKDGKWLIERVDFVPLTPTPGE